MNDIEATTAENDGWDWAIVEIYGHRRHAGRTREEERFGSKMLRIDIPTFAPAAASPGSDGEEPRFELSWTTHYYGGASIFSFTLTDEGSVMRANRPYQSPYRARLPAPDEFDFDPGDPDDD